MGSTLHAGVTVGIPTKNRYNQLCNTLYSIINQTVKPSEVIIVDDSDVPTDIREISIYRNLFKLLDDYKIKWKVLYGQKKGQHHSHQLIQEIAENNLIFKIDDDEVAEYNTLELLLESIDKNIGAVAPAVLIPSAECWQCSHRSWLGYQPQECLHHPAGLSSLAAGEKIRGTDARMTGNADG